MRAVAKNKSDLTVVNGGGEGSELARKRRSLEDEPLQCPECQGSAVMTVVIGPRRHPKTGILSGAKTIICAFCMAEGEIVELGKVN